MFITFMYVCVYILINTCKCIFPEEVQFTGCWGGGRSCQCLFPNNVASFWNHEDKDCWRNSSLLSFLLQLDRALNFNLCVLIREKSYEARIRNASITLVWRYWWREKSKGAAGRKKWKLLQQNLQWKKRLFRETGSWRSDILI